MKRNCLIVPLTCIALTLFLYGGVFAACYEKPCDRNTMDTGDCLRLKYEYEDCLKREKAEREARRAAEAQAGREKAGEGVVKEPEKTYRYPFLEDVREVNKKERRF